MFRMVARLSSTAVTASIRSLFISTTSADSMATSVPAPMARPTSDRARAGASLMPSPTMATFLPWACNSAMTFSLSWGSTSATTSVKESSFAIALAVRRLSPVSMTTSSPSSRMALMAAAEVGFTISATATSPNSIPSLAK